MSGGMDDGPAGVALAEDLPDTTSCPACGRPLETLSGVCAGCGSLLVIGVQAKRAAVFVGFGLVAGLLVGSLSMRLISPSVGVGPNAVAPSGSAAGNPTGPTASAAAIAPASSTVPPGFVPRDAANSLRQVVVIDGRLHATADILRRVLAAKPFDPAAAAQSLRDVAADAAVGAQYPPGLAVWPAAVPLQSEVAGFYEGVLAIARQGLSFSIADARAYRSATAEMIVRFRSLGAIDAAVRTLAATAGIEIAPEPPPVPSSPTAP